MRFVGKLLLGIVVFLLFTVGVGLLVRYLLYRNDPDPNKTFLAPHCSAVELEVVDLRKDTADLRARVLLTNPLQLALTLDSMGYEFYIQGDEVMRSTRREKFTLEKGDSTWVEVPVTIFNKKLVNVLNGLDAAGLDSVTYEIRTTMFMGKRPFQVKISRYLPLFRIPDVKITGFKTDTFRLTHAVIHATVSVTNHNVFPIVLKDIRYQFALAGSPWVLGTRTDITELPPNGHKNVVFPLYIPFKGMGKAFVELIKKGKEVPYRMKIRFVLHTDLKFLHDSRIALEGDGKMSEVLEMVK
jgi:LEA14-like dessication related protein